MKQLTSKADLEILIPAFYARVREDDFIGPIFKRVLADHWDEHLAKITNFWEALLFDGQDYHGRPFPPHIPLGLQPEHFKRWLELFFTTMDEHFTGQKAEEAKMRAFNIGKNFLANLDHLSKQGRL